MRIHSGAHHWQHSENNMARNVLCAVEDGLREHDYVTRKRAKQARKAKRRPVTARQRSNPVKNPRR